MTISVRVFVFLISAVTLWAPSSSDAQDAEWQNAWQAATVAAQKQDFAEAVKQTTLAIDQGLTEPQVYYHRGRWNFRAGKAKESVADFDQFLAATPSRSNSLWERGISCYYAGDFKAGAKQFADYQKYHNNDVENAVWRYLCQMKYDGTKKAREAILPIKNDRRIPMMEIYKMFKGESEPAKVLEVLAASKAKDEAAKNEAMHAHLYVGLFYDSEGDEVKAREHIQLAVKQFDAGSYMWSVAVVHGKQWALK